MDRTILHCDLNNFFASVAVLDNPTLKNCPLAVTGSVEERHGIVLAKNELAKSYGVATAEAIWQAKRKCPELVCVPPNYHRYNEVSMAVRDIYLRFSDAVEPFGIDECWLDVTGSRLLFGNGMEIAEQIRAAVKREIGVTVSIGVSFNKVFAKLGSDLKKPDGITEISRENFKEKVWPLPANALLGVGRSTKNQLDSLGIFTIGDIAAAGCDVLKNRFGKMGEQLYLSACGEDSSPVATEESAPKSVGRTTTLSSDLHSAEEAWPVVLSLSENISETLRRHGLYCGAVQAHIRTFDLNVKEFQAALPAPTQSSMVMAEKCMELIENNFGFSVPLRSIGFRAINLKDAAAPYQTDIFTDFHEAESREEVEDKIFEIRQKYGKDSIVRGTTVNTHIHDRDE
ncbi:MAG: DNA polymerase IV [Clostridia bacterium]|nr:DNA polymerase IV [Clostridia bacterium]MBR3593728.1 DNA polymerase IV [Clostridia bacterium]